MRTMLAVTNEILFHRLGSLVESELKRVDSEVSKLVEVEIGMTRAKLCQREWKGYAYLYTYEGMAEGKQKQRIVKESDRDFVREIVMGEWVRERIRFLEAYGLLLRNFGKGQHSIMAVLSKRKKKWDRLEEVTDFLTSEYDTYFHWGEEERAELKGSRREFFPEGKKHEIHTGEKLRSKSEVIISNLLEQNEVSYIYEQVVSVGERELFPDFTVMNRRTGEVFYWEHFGLTTDENYRIRMEKKMTAYREAGIMPWGKLITTYETPEKGLELIAIQRIIEVFLL